LYYNYFRYYDPETGRYVTSDPIGLGGGLNTYAHVYENPLRYFDSLGLFSCLKNGKVNPTGMPSTAAEGAAAWAQYQYEIGSKDFTLDSSALPDCGGSGKYKCNCFVKHAYQEGGNISYENLPKHYYNDKPSKYFATANELADDDLNKNILGKGKGSRGNIVIWPKKGDSGHAGIVGCDGKIYSAVKDGIARWNRDYSLSQFTRYTLTGRKYIKHAAMVRVNSIENTINNTNIDFCFQYNIGK